MVKSYIYDLFVTPYTYPLLKSVYESLPNNSKILDVGIGTGTAVIENKDIIIRKNFFITGIDINKDYIDKCNQNIEKYDLYNYIEVIQNTVFLLETYKKFDIILFSDSYAVIPEVEKMVEFCNNTFLRKNGSVIIITALFETKNVFLEWIKQNFCYLTSIDLGRMVTKDEIYKFKPSINFLKSYYFPFFGNIKMYSVKINKN